MNLCDYGIVNFAISVFVSVLSMADLGTLSNLKQPPVYVPSLWT